MDKINLNQSGIYAITSPSGKMYIGSAVNIRQRWWRHRSDLAQGKHHCSALQRAYHKYGDTLVYSVLVLCPEEELVWEEQQQMDEAPMGSLYNSSLTAGSILGFRLSEEAKSKMSAAHTGKKRPNNASGYVGVSLFRKYGKYKAEVRVNYRRVYLGLYPTAELANEARQNFNRALRFYDSSWTTP